MADTKTSPPHDVSTVTLAGLIDDNMLNNLINAIAANCPQVLDMRINSIGGNMSSAIAIYNTLQEFSGDIITHNIGSVQSAAIFPYLAGNRRFAVPGAWFMIHGARRGDINNATELTLLNTLTTVRFDNAAMKPIIVQNTNFTDKEIDAVLKGTEVYLDGSQAIEKGVCHEIKEL